MTDEKQIEEIEKIAKIVGWHCNEKSMDYCDEVDCCDECLARDIYNAGYRNCKDKVVLTNEEYDELLKGVKTTNYTAMFDNTQAQRIIDLEMRLAQARKEMAREVLDKVYDWGQGFFIEHSFMEEDEFNGILDEVKKLFLNVVEV